jgi:hypothetical protein
MNRVTTIPNPPSAPGAAKSTADRYFHCGRDLYGLQTLGAVSVCGRSDCLAAALATAGRLERKGA